MKVRYRDQQVELQKNDGFYLSDKTKGIELVQHDEETLFLVTPSKVLTVRCLEINKAEKSVTLLHNGSRITVSITEPLDELLKSMGLEDALTPKINDLKAPMPGLVLDVLVNPGDTVKKGDTLLILEAMKMENAIKSPADLTIKEVHTTKSSAVDKNEVLITFAS